MTTFNDKSTHTITVRICQHESMVVKLVRRKRIFPTPYVIVKVSKKALLDETVAKLFDDLEQFINRKMETNINLYCDSDKYFGFCVESENITQVRSAVLLFSWGMTK